MARLGIGDRLNDNSKMGVVFTKQYRKVQLDPRTLIPSQANSYSQDNIEELADNMLLVGQLQEIIVGRVDGQDRIIVGHRRTTAAVLNIERGHEDFKKVDCKIKEMSEAMFMLTLHSANIFSRKLKDWELIQGATEFKKYLLEAREAGDVIIEGKMRDYVADAMGVSSTKMAQMESINNNLCKEGKEALKNEEINFTTAYEASKLSEEKQKEVVADKELLSKDVKKMVDDEKTAAVEKKEPKPTAVKKFYDLTASKYDNDRSKLKELLIEHCGKSYNGGSQGGLNYSCSPKGIKLEAADEITWARYVQMINELYPRDEKDKEEELEGQQILPSVDIKKDTAHFKIEGVLNPDYTPCGLSYAFYITAILHSGIMSKDFIEAYKGSRGVNALCNLIEDYRSNLMRENEKIKFCSNDYNFKHEGNDCEAYADEKGWHVDYVNGYYRNHIKDYELMELMEAMLEAGYFGVVETLKYTIQKAAKKVSESDTHKAIGSKLQKGIAEGIKGAAVEQIVSQVAAVENQEEVLDMGEATGMMCTDLFQIKEYISEDDFYLLQEIVINCEVRARKGCISTMNK
ncbi:MAG: ParB/RepB/Spo0J family partition protein [Lachnotalea sp.]